MALMSEYVGMESCGDTYICRRMVVICMCGYRKSPLYSGGIVGTCVSCVVRSSVHCAAVHRWYRVEAPILAPRGAVAVAICR